MPGFAEVECVVANNSADVKNNFHLQIPVHQNINLMDFPDNPGYFGAAHKVCSQKKLSSYRFVIISNSDLKMESRDFYEKLLNLQIDHNLGAIAPSIKSELTQSQSNPLYTKKPSHFKIWVLKVVYSVYLIAWFYHLLSWFKTRFFSQKPESINGSKMYALNGAFIIVCHEYFKRGGNFEYPVKLYGEELFLAEKMSQLNLDTIYLPSLKIIHREKGTEGFWLARYALSYKTFKFKNESVKFLDSLYRSR